MATLEVRAARKPAVVLLRIVSRQLESVSRSARVVTVRIGVARVPVRPEEEYHTHPLQVSWT